MIKNNIKVFISIIVSGIIFTGVGVYAAQYSVSQITYNKNRQATVNISGGGNSTNFKDILYFKIYQ